MQDSARDDFEKRLSDIRESLRPALTTTLPWTTVEDILDRVARYVLETNIELPALDDSGITPEGLNAIDSWIAHLNDEVGRLQSQAAVDRLALELAYATRGEVAPAPTASWYERLQQARSVVAGVS